MTDHADHVAVLDKEGRPPFSFPYRPAFPREAAMFWDTLTWLLVLLLGGGALALLCRLALGVARVAAAHPRWVVVGLISLLGALGVAFGPRAWARGLSQNDLAAGAAAVLTTALFAAILDARRWRRAHRSVDAYAYWRRQVSRR